MIDNATLIRDLKELREKIHEDLERLDSIIETLEIMSNEDFMKSIKRGLEDIEKGNVIDFEDLLKEIEDQ
jgi:predicted transcriptional regulator